ncbi:NUT family member 1 [Ornithorhynchus anatinus]|uniref:NUT family member 1 n=1 Tax=Ornithorhynchus anatinus TaxID=9258 RepID=UPI0010A7561C|nr:NUT family member 1 [Ornithorhynchus anatinus]
MFPLASPLLQPVFPGMMLLPGHRAAAGVSAPGRVVIKVQADGHPEEAPHPRTFVLTQTTLNCVTPGPHTLPSPEGIPPHFLAPPNVKTTMLLAKAPPARFPSSVPQNQAWAEERAPRGWDLPSGPPDPRTELGNLSCASKGVYENFRRWQHYKALARMYLPCSPDTEALACFLIPVLRSLARLKPTMTVEEALARAVQEWERNSNFDRMIFYEMGEKFMEFEAEEEMQRMQLLGGSLYPVLQACPKFDPSGLPDPDACQQQVCTSPKVAFQIHHQHQDHQGPPPLPLPHESPQEAVTQCADGMAGQPGARPATALGQWQEEPEEAEEAEEEVEEVKEVVEEMVEESEESEEGEEEAKEEAYLDPGLLRYVEELCTQDAFVSKVEAVIHPRFLAEVLSPELQRDPLALSEELEQEEELTPAQLIQKRFLALWEEGVEQEPSSFREMSNSSPSSEEEGVEEEEEEEEEEEKGPPLSGALQEGSEAWELQCRDHRGPKAERATPSLRREGEWEWPTQAAPSEKGPSPPGDQVGRQLFQAPLPEARHQSPSFEAQGHSDLVKGKDGDFPQESSSALSPAWGPSNLQGGPPVGSRGVEGDKDSDMTVFSFLLAAKLSLSPRGPASGPSTGKPSLRGPPQSLDTWSHPTGTPGLSARKRCRDSNGPGRRKKRRRSL